MRCGSERGVQTVALSKRHWMAYSYVLVCGYVYEQTLLMFYNDNLIALDWSQWTWQHMLQLIFLFGNQSVINSTAYIAYSSSSTVRRELSDRQDETSSVLSTVIQNFLFSQRFLRRNIRLRVDHNSLPTGFLRTLRCRFWISCFLTSDDRSGDTSCGCAWAAIQNSSHFSGQNRHHKLLKPKTSYHRGRTVSTQQG